MDLLRRHHKSILAVVCLIAVAHVVKIVIMQRKRLHQQKSSSGVPGSEATLFAGQKADRKGAANSRQSCAISEVSSVERSASASPQPYLTHVAVKEGTSPSLVTQDGPIVESEYYPDSLHRDHDGRMYVIHRHGEYIEVWEADEYGQVKDSSANYGDPDEHCVELLSHFKREASMSMKENQEQL
jgi:hypothetical protein